VSADAAVIDRLFAALTRGDVDAAIACLAENARVWHSFDCVAHDKPAMRAQWQALVDNFPERAFVDVRRSPIAEGLVQQQVMVVTTGSGQRKAWPTCFLARIEDGLVVRLDEYMDRAGAFDPDPDKPAATPGLD
jgi:ketosteroid isomerase-like protein